MFGSIGDLRNQLLRSGVGVIAINISGMLLTLMTNVVLARLLGPIGYGKYSFILILVGFLIILTQVGLPQLIIREVAIVKHRKQVALLNGLLIRANQIIISLTMIVVLVISFVVYKIELRSLIVTPRELLWGLAILSLLNISSISGAALIGFGRTVSGEFLRTTLQRLFILLIVGILAFVTQRKSFTAIDILQINLIATFFSMCIGTFLLVRALPVESWSTRPIFDDRRWFIAVMPFIILSGGQIGMGIIDSFMVGLLGTSTETGIYRIAAQAAYIIVLTLGAVNIVIASFVARFHDAGEHEKLQQLVLFGARAALIGALPFAIGFILFGRDILIFLYGKAFAPGYIALAILSGGQLINAAFGPVGYILTMTGNTWYNAIGTIMALLLNIFLNLVLIPSYSLIGAAWAATISLIIWNVILFYFVWKQTKLISFALWWKV